MHRVLKTSYSRPTERNSLNLAIHGVLKPGDHVVTSMAEHNSVLRPLRFLEDKKQITVTRIKCDETGKVDPIDIRDAIRPETKLIALIHASNVTGAIQPVYDVGQIAREAGVMYLIDAAQSLGHIDIDSLEVGASFIAAPGHKGLLGPLGTGVLFVSPANEEDVVPLRQGGTGTESETDRQPTTCPDRFESGNHNVAGLAGLKAGLEFLTSKGLKQLRDRQEQLSTKLLDGLAAIPQVKIYGPSDPTKRVGVVSISLEGYDPQEVASMLDSAYSIQVRSGIHCAPMIHKSLGTMDNGGTVRFSLGAFSTDSDIETTIAAVADISGAIDP